MLKVLYIDNKNYLHNADSHVDFVQSLEKNGLFKIIGLGNYLKRRFKTSYALKENFDKQLQFLLIRYKPSFILTYNSGPDIIQKYDWASKSLSKARIPKIHIATDFMRDGFDPELSAWLERVGYNAIMFRHKESMKYPLSMDKFYLPISINAPLYSKNSEKMLSRKKNLVGFIGSSHIDQDLYQNRIKAMRALGSSDLLRETKFVKKQGRSQMMFGEHYVKFITKNLFGLTCGGTCNYFVAKHFQIPAAYSMLICTDVPGLEIFPKESYIKYDPNNLNKLIEDVTFHINNKDIVREKISILHKYVLINHNHKARGEELLDFVNKII
tara:strand:- start:1140 stop:2117 length:978 start_codon:yes stop_codon:yes gene_type:complete